MLVSIVIPVYKSTSSLEILTRQINELEKEIGHAFEIIFVNDSPFFHDTCKTLQKVNEQHANVKVLTLRKNQGQQLALLVGLKNATGEYLITMDDDLQHPVSEIPKLIKAINENKDIEAIFAIPSYLEKKHNLWRNFGSFFLNKLDTLFLKKPKGLLRSPFRIITYDLAQAIINNHNAMPAFSSLIINTTNNIINIRVQHEKRQFGKSNYNLRQLISLSFNNMLHYSSLPLKVVGIIGIIGFLFSVLFILLVIARKFFGGIDFPGYASTVSLISFFGGLNLFAIGLIGEYLIRIIKEQQKPNLSDLVKKQSS